jgi:galactokinase
MSDWVEVGDRVFVRRYAFYDQNIGVALGDAGVLVIDTRVSHALTDGSYGDRRDECARAAAALGGESLRDVSLRAVEDLADPVLRRRAHHVVTENLRVLAAVGAIGDRNWHALAEALDASHTSMRDDFEISCAELDLAVDTARAAGALGARMTGGGFGGSAVALVSRADVPQVRSDVTSAFVRAGHQEPAYLVATPGDAARIESVS